MSRTILVADDSAAIQKRVSAILASEGLEVFTVSNGVAAIKKLPVLKPLLVLADVSMPGKDGYEVCEYVKAATELAYIPVLLLVSDLEPYDEQRGAQVRANGVVQKPFEPEALISEVNRFVAQAEAALAEAQVADTAINIAPPAPESNVEVPSAQEEPEPAPRSEGLDWGALPAGSAFGEVAPYEPPPPPDAASFLSESQYQAEPEAPAAEAVPDLATAYESFPAELSGITAPAGYPAEAAFAPAEPEVAFASPEPEIAFAPSEPVFIEEATPAAPDAVQGEGPETTMMFHAPVEIAEPVLQDELAPAPPVEAPPTPYAEEAPLTATEPELEVPAVAPEPEAAFAPMTEPEAAPVVEEAPAPVIEEPAASPVDLIPPAEEAASAEIESQPLASEPQPAEVIEEPVIAPPILNDEWIFWIVRSVVVKMSPPALSNEAIEEMARRIAAEITAELDYYNQRG